MNPIVYKVMDYVIVTCQIINAPIHEPFFYWMILCLIFAKGNFRTVSGIIIVLHWALYSIATMTDQMRYYYIPADKTLDREVKWKKYDSLIVLLNYLSEIAGDWYPVYVIYKNVPEKFFKKLSTCFCLFFNITKLLPPVHFYSNYDNCNTFITYKVVEKCLHTDFWITWTNLQCIISLGTLIYYLLCMVILNKAKYPVSRNVLNCQSFFKKFRNYSPYRIRILCLISILSSFTVIPLAFHARNIITYDLELLRALLKNFSYYIIYFDRILLANFSDPNYSTSIPPNNRNMYMNLKENRIFKEDPLSVTKPSGLFVSSNMESNSSTYNSYLKSKSPDYFMYSRGESSNTNIEDDPTISNNIKSTLKVNVNRLGIDESNSNNDELFKDSPNYYSPYDTPLGTPKKVISVFDYPLVSPKSLNSPGSKSPFNGNIYSDKARLNSDFDGFDIENNDVLFPSKEDINRFGSGNGNGNGSGNNKKINVENKSTTESTIPSTLTLPPFRTEKDNNNNNYMKFTDYSQDDATSFSQYSKNSLSHQREASKGSFFFNTGKENDSFGVYNRNSLSHQRTISKGSSFFSTPKMQQVSTRSVNSIIETNKFNLSIPRSYQTTTNDNNSINRHHNNNKNNNNNNNNMNINNNNNLNIFNINQNNNGLNDISLMTESSITSFIHSNFNSPYIPSEKLYIDKNMDKSFDRSYDRSYDQSMEISLNNSSIDDSSINNISNVNRMLQKMSSLKVNDNGLINVNKKK